MVTVCCWVVLTGHSRDRWHAGEGRGARRRTRRDGRPAFMSVLLLCRLDTCDAWKEPMQFAQLTMLNECCGVGRTTALKMAAQHCDFHLRARERARVNPSHSCQNKSWRRLPQLLGSCGHLNPSRCLRCPFRTNVRCLFIQLLVVRHWR